MKADLHPTYYSDAVAVCACGNQIVTGSTKRALDIVVCSNCHPFYTGAQTFVDTQGRIEKFRAKQKGASATVVRKIRPQQVKPEAEPKSLKEMLTSK